MCVIVRLRSLFRGRVYCVHTCVERRVVCVRVCVRLCECMDGCQECVCMCGLQTLIRL